MFLMRPGVWSDGPMWAGALADRPSAGWKILVPGYAQWCWRQRERALALAGSFVAALGVGAFAWGTWTGLAVLAFAFGTHVASAVDVIRQSAFPGFGRWMPVASVSGGLAAGVYAPALVVASLVAWPVSGGGAAPEGYLVNCWAYRGAVPRPGAWVWMRTSPWGELHVGRVVAGPGHEVEWSGRRFRVNGRTLEEDSPFRSSPAPDELLYKVPAGHVLVHSGTSLAGESAARDLVLVAQDQIQGRVWARSYPVWERQVLQ